MPVWLPVLNSGYSKSTAWEGAWLSEDGEVMGGGWGSDPIRLSMSACLSVCLSMCACLPAFLPACVSVMRMKDSPRVPHAGSHLAG